MSQLYTIYVFTAASSSYANAIVQYLDPKKQWIMGTMSRSNCMETKNGFFIKDLRIVANKQLRDMVIVDNLAHSFGF
jgi:CTD small phosphatase-like protein 2